MVSDPKATTKIPRNKHPTSTSYTLSVKPSVGKNTTYARMATTIPSNPTPQTISLLLSKTGDADPDFRFMALSDLLTVLSISRPDLLHHDYNTSSRTVDHVVKALDDQNSEVQNQAIKWYVDGPAACCPRLPLPPPYTSFIANRLQSRPASQEARP